MGFGFRVWGSILLQGDYLGDYYRVVKGDTRSLDDSSHDRV